MMIEIKTTYGSAWVNPEFVSSVDFQDTAAFVRCDGTDYRVAHEEASALLEKINGKSGAPVQQPQSVQVRSIKSIERTSTYSNSEQKTFDFWRCVMDNGQKVNVFDHPDDKRNTYKILCANGWEDVFECTDEGIEYELDDAIPVTVSFDGEWFSLVDIQAIGQYMQAHSITRESSILPHYEDDFDPDEHSPISDAPFIDFDDDDSYETIEPEYTGDGFTEEYEGDNDGD